MSEMSRPAPPDRRSSFAWIGGLRNMPTHLAMSQKIDKAKLEGSSSSLLKFRLKVPRLYHILFGVVIPLLLLIAWAILCGHFLALLEMENERKSNNAVISKYVQESQVLSLPLAIEQAYDFCIENFIKGTASELVDGTELEEFIETCTAPVLLKSEQDVENSKQTRLNTLYNSGLSFEWNKCTEENSSRGSDSKARQGEVVYDEWMNSYTKNLDEDEYNATITALGKASGSTKCRVNSAGGAMFWFTIMTTIGYGNVAPASSEGRALVYTLGFLSIMGFTTCIGSASYVGLCIVDDFFQRFKIRKLVDGAFAALFWLTMFWIGILSIAALAHVYREVRYETLPFIDLIWFSFVSITTVGFGDIHVPHERFRYVDFLYIPTCMLLGTVMLANFMLKFSGVFLFVMDKYGLGDGDVSFEHILERSREERLELDKNAYNPRDNDDFFDNPEIDDTKKGSEIFARTDGQDKEPFNFTILNSDAMLPITEEDC